MAIFSAEDLDLGGHVVNVEKLQSIANAMKTVEDFQTVVEGIVVEHCGFLGSVGCMSMLARSELI